MIISEKIKKENLEGNNCFKKNWTFILKFWEHYKVMNKKNFKEKQA